MHLRKLLPSTGALFMFEAAARHLNFTAAGRESNVSQSAVSHMMGRLEAHLGVKLFVRNPKGLQLTEEGRLLAQAVSHGFQKVETVLNTFQAKNRNTGIVTISVSSAFAMYWFMPRFDTFRQRFPEIDLRFQVIHGEPVGPFDGVDLGIRYRPHPGPSHHNWKLTDEVVIPVCSPGYLEAHGGLDECRDLHRHTLANLSGLLRVPWQRYLRETGYPDNGIGQNLIFSDYALVIQAAIKGQAIALGWWHVVAHELSQHGLVRAGRRQLKTGDGYYLSAPASRPVRKPTAMVRDWLIEEMAGMADI